LAAKLGATATVGKPFLPNSLLSLVDALLSASHAAMTP